MYLSSAITVFILEKWYSNICKYILFFNCRYFFFLEEKFDKTHRNGQPNAGTKMNTFQYIFKKFVPSFLNSTLFTIIMRKKVEMKDFKKIYFII